MRGNRILTNDIELPMSKRHDPLPDGSSPTSSKPQRLPKKQAELYRDVLTILEKKRIPLAVSGTYALQLHTGICRDTKDLDIFLSAQNASVALACLAKHGFRCEVRDPVWLAKAYRDKYFVDLITGMSNAVIVVDDSWIAHSRPMEVLGIPTRILAPEELLVSKLFVTRRERFDGADIAHIIYATRGQMDWNRIVHYAGEHWEVLLWAFIVSLCLSRPDQLRSCECVARFDCAPQRCGRESRSAADISRQPDR